MTSRSLRAVRPVGDAAALGNGERDKEGLRVAGADDGSVYVDELEVAWVCEHEAELGYICAVPAPSIVRPAQE